MPSNAKSPDLEWYVAMSNSKELPTARCPFASVHKCPRYYESLSLLSNAGHTAIDPAMDKKLLKKWKRHCLWPVVSEQASSVSGPEGKPHLYSQFCPEVSHHAFGLFASDLADFADETDRESQQAGLVRELAPANDWRWTWSSVHPLHYSECPLYARLTQEKKEETTLVDRITSWGKNNPLVAAAIVVMAVLGALAAMTKDFSTLLDALKGEHGVVVITKIGSGDVSSRLNDMDNNAFVQFDPKDSKQRIQQINLIWPEGIGTGTENEVVFPPLKRDLAFETRGMNNLLQPMIPRTVLEPPYHSFLTQGSIPVVLRVNFLSSSGDAKSEDLLYELDFIYNVTQDCSRGCATDTWGFGLRDLHYVRPIHWNENAKSLIADQMAQKHFAFEPGF